MSVAAR
jgi:3-hydroxyisobutyryl-CoA hydrolase